MSFTNLKVDSIQCEGSVKFDLELILWERQEGVGGFIAYNADLFKKHTVDDMLQHLDSKE